MIRMITIGQNIAEEVKINKYKLDEELQVQASLYEYYSKQLALEKNNADRIKLQLEILKGKKTIDYKRNPPQDIKITDATIDALLANDSDIIELNNQLLACTAKINILYSAVNSINQKRDALKNLVQLTTTKYYDTLSEEISIGLDKNENEEE